MKPCSLPIEWLWLSSRPAKMQEILNIDIPLTLATSVLPRYLELRDELLKQIGLAYEI